MNEIQISMSKLRQNLGSLVNRAAFGGEYIILVSHGEPKAAIISFDELQRLKQLQDIVAAHPHRYKAALDNLNLIREQIAEWQAENHIEPENSVDTLNALRAERDDELANLR